MLLTLAVGFGLGVLATVVAGERDKRRTHDADIPHHYSTEQLKSDRARVITIGQFFRPVYSDAFGDAARAFADGAQKAADAAKQLAPHRDPFFGDVYVAQDHT